MDTNLVKIFLTYSKTENLRMTAELHNTSHVAIIRALKSLEAETGVKLNKRVGRGSVLTPEGKSLIKYAEKIIEEENKFLQAANSENRSFNEYSIATFEVFSTHLSPIINQELGLETKLTWPEKTPGEIEHAVKSRLVNIGITYLPIPTPEVEHLKVTSISMAVYRGKKPLYSQSDIKTVPFVIPTHEHFNTPSKAKGLDGWPDYKSPRNIHYRVTLLESALAMVASGQCVGYFPKFIADIYNQHEQRLIEVPEWKVNTPKQDVFLVKRIENEETKHSKKVAKILRRLK